PQDGSCGPVNRDANCLGSVLLCCVLRRGPRRTSEPTDRTTADPFWPDPKAGKARGFSSPSGGEAPKPRGGFPPPAAMSPPRQPPPSPGTRRGSLFEVAAASLAE